MSPRALITVCVPLEILAFHAGMSEEAVLKCSLWMSHVFIVFEKWSQGKSIKSDACEM